MKKIIEGYANTTLHRRIAEIIERHSSNRKDIRDEARRLIRWQDVRTILDLGCGYGWFENALEGSFDLIYGVDYLEENEKGFLRAAERIARKALFKKASLPTSIDMPSGSFDLALAAYSLYFFPEMLGEVKRLLAEKGIFLIITHSESMLEEGERYFDFSGLKMVIRRFSAENGEEMLRKFFPSVTAIDYPNELVFGKDDAEDLADYIDFKKEFISIDADPGLVKDKMISELMSSQELRFNKNDRIFIARR